MSLYDDVHREALHDWLDVRRDLAADERPDPSEYEDRETAKPPPMRGELSPDVQAAARTVHREVWGQPYKPLEGPMHYAGGPYWRNELLRLADKWERMAVAARVCAEVLPNAATFDAQAPPSAAASAPKRSSEQCANTPETPPLEQGAHRG
jgi:hypothetical protein